MTSRPVVDASLVGLAVCGVLVMPAGLAVAAEPPELLDRETLAGLLDDDTRDASIDGVVPWQRERIACTERQTGDLRCVHRSHRVLYLDSASSVADHGWIPRVGEDPEDTWRARVLAVDGSECVYEAADLQALAEDLRAWDRQLPIPDIEPHSLVELVTVTHSHGIPAERLTWHVGWLPVLDFELTLDAPAGYEDALQLDRLPVETRRESLDEGRWRLRVTSDSIAPPPREADELDWTDRGWVSERTWALVPPDPRAWAAPWSAALRDALIAFAQPWRREALATIPTLDLTACGGDDARCRIDAVLDALPARLALTDLVLDGRLDRDIADYATDDHGDPLDKAALTVAWLDTLGIEARIALTAAPDTLALVAASADVDVIDRALVHVPTQAGLPDPVWLDPTCESCEVGEVAHGLVGRTAVVAVIDATTPNKRKVRTELLDIEAVEPPPSVIRTEVRAALGADLALTVEERRTVTGELATHELARRGDRRDDALASRLESVGDRGHHPWRSELDEDGSELPACDRRAARCESMARYRVTHAAVADADATEAHLAWAPLMTEPQWDPLNLGHARRTALVVEHPVVLEQDVEVELAPWFEVGRLPDPIDETVDGGRLVVEVTPTDTGVRIHRRLELAGGHHAMTGRGAGLQALVEHSVEAIEDRLELRATFRLNAPHTGRRLVESLAWRDRAAIERCLATDGQPLRQDTETRLLWTSSPAGAVRTVARDDGELSDDGVACLLGVAAGWRLPELPGEVAYESTLQLEAGQVLLVSADCTRACTLTGDSLALQGDATGADAVYTRACEVDEDADACARLAGAEPGARARESADETIDAVLVGQLAPRLAVCERDDVPVRRVELSWRIDGQRTTDLTLPANVGGDDVACLRAAFDDVQWPVEQMGEPIRRALRLHLEVW